MNLFTAISYPFWILVCKSYESERSGKAVYGESVESISFFMAYIYVFTIHSFPSDYNCNQSVNVTKITSQLDRCIITLLLRKIQSKCCLKLEFFKINFFV